MRGSTIGPIDVCIVEALEAAFEAETGIRVLHAEAGIGAALDMAKRGGIDLVVVQARKREEAFVKEGFGTGRIPVMYNDFVIVCPTTDPAGIRGLKSATEALKPERKGQVMVDGDGALLNYISLIPVNPAKVAKVNTTDVATFLAWLTHPDKGQKLIAGFGKAKPGAPPFTPKPGNSDVSLLLSPSSLFKRSFKQG